VTRPDPRDQFLRTLKGELGGRPWTRRRALREIAEHLDDLVTELLLAGVPEGDAVQEALRRMGHPATIATAFSELQPDRSRWSKLRSLRSPAWIAVAAMSLVTAWAAELPQASGAQGTVGTPRPARVLPAHRLTPPALGRHAPRAKPHSLQTSRISIGGQDALRTP